MAAITFHADGLRPLDGAIVRPKTAGEALTVNKAVFLDTDGTIMKAAAAGPAIGLVVATERKTAAVAEGQVAAVCVFGPVAGFTGLVPGTKLYLAADGGLADTGTVVIGYAETTETAVILPTVANTAS